MSLMLRIFSVILFLLISVNTLSQNPKNKNQPITNNISINTPDTLRINIDTGELVIPSTIKIESDYDFLSDSMPWVVALILGGISLYIGHAQIQIQRKIITSQSRQDWINTLRDVISSYLGKIEHYSVLFSYSKNDALKMDDLVKQNVQQEIYSLEVKISLLLNPLETTSQLLNQNLKKYTEQIFAEEKDLKKEAQLKNEILATTKSILKEEWERVKSGK